MSQSFRTASVRRVRLLGSSRSLILHSRYSTGFPSPLAENGITRGIDISKRYEGGHREKFISLVRFYPPIYPFDERTARNDPIKICRFGVVAPKFFYSFDSGTGESCCETVAWLPRRRFMDSTRRIDKYPGPRDPPVSPA